MGHGTDEKQKSRPSPGNIITLITVGVFVLLYGWLFLKHFGPQQAVLQPGGGSILSQQQFGSSRAVKTLQSSGSGAADAAAGGLSLPATTLEYFPQAGRCSTKWMQQHVQLQADIQAGKLPERYFVSVAVEAGLADRLAGLMTHFWHAVVTRRAFTTVAYGNVPSFSAMCDAPFIDWTHPPAELPAEAVEPLKFTYMGERGYPGHKRFLPDTLDPKTYQMLYLINGPMKNLTVYQNSNISALQDPDPAYLMAASNRGRSFALANNPFHKQQFWEYGVVPQDAFMCGFFYMCSPVAAIQQYYKQYWDVLREPGVLKVGIQIRLGDGVFKGAEKEQPAEVTLKAGKEWFECAQLVEKHYAAPGQKVLWYLNSDSQQLRKAAKTVYGDKLITDDELKMTHPDCHQDKPKGANSSSTTDCEQAAMDEALQHSLGAMLTFSMTDYHVITKGSGFGRLGAWLSGRWGNIFNIVRGQGSVQCQPSKPIPPEQSAFHYSGV
jgi:hypothetical protein